MKDSLPTAPADSRGLTRLNLVEPLIPLLAIISALLIGALLIRLSGASVIDAYTGLFEGMAGSWKAVSETLVSATPYILTGLAVAVCFRCGLFNIGAEGQFYLGALTSSIIGVWGTGLPPVLHVTAALAGGFLGGAVWGAIPGILKVRFGAHEVISTIMLNYVAISLVDFLVKNVFRDPSASMDRTPFILESAHLPYLFGSDYRLHAGFLLALLATVIIARVLSRTTFGFEIKTVGANPSAARYSGMKTGRIIVLAMTLGGGLAGLAGAGEVMGLKHNLPAAFSTGYGFDAIAVALLAKANLWAVIPAALIWGGMKNGAGLMQIRSGISIDLISVIQALVLLFIAADPIIRWMYRLNPKRKVKAVFSRSWGSDS